ncbi:hypothetical protein [Streptomyces sp. HB132]|uniref:hypothetical protein n=1 Tax=Streptomyces sp. HB132 TaxID=767388 RepID=UPI00196181F1|nr:hypothetical protein [Streptomyces sp. HB132]MBM7440267.1 hypothetical protein [Streptomyces sp. HB132]
MTWNAEHRALTDEVAKAVLAVEGVAFLKPGVARQLRTALAPEAESASARTSGLRVRRKNSGCPWNVAVQIVSLREARAVDVARATRTAVEACLAAKCPEEPPAPAHITVTVTGLL